MSFQLCVTGGIGCGKSTVSQMIAEQCGAPIFEADSQLKQMLVDDPKVQAEIAELLGFSILTDEGTLDKFRIGQAIFNDADLLKRYEIITHTALHNRYKAWVQDHIDRPLLIYEAAIVLEKKRQTFYDALLLVCADTEIRIERVLKRNPELTREDILSRMKLQWSDQKKMKHTDFVIFNENNLTYLRTKVNRILHILNR